MPIKATPAATRTPAQLPLFSIHARALAMALEPAVASPLAVACRHRRKTHDLHPDFMRHLLARWEGVRVAWLLVKSIS